MKTKDRMINRASTPIPYGQSVQRVREEGITTSRLGKVVPMFARLLQPNDGIGHSPISFLIQTEELQDQLHTPINFRLTSFVVPFVAFDRFKGMDDWRRTFTGKEKIASDNDNIVEAISYDKTTDEIMRCFSDLPDSLTMSDGIYQAYNTFVNYSRQMVQNGLPERELDDDTLARAFWLDHPKARAKTSFDDAARKMLVELEVAQSYEGDTKLPVDQLFYVNSGPTNNNSAMREWQSGNQEGSGTSRAVYAKSDGETFDPDDQNAAPNVDIQPLVDVLSGGTGNFSIASIKQAQRQGMLARYAQRYRSINLHEQDVYEMLMKGHEVSDNELLTPYILDREYGETDFQSRFATDSGNLTDSISQGMSAATVDLACPVIKSGGIVMVVAEVVPKLGYERQGYPEIIATDHTDWPDPEGDSLSLQMVDPITNNQVDVDHTEPTGLFGYEPMNSYYYSDAMRVGGRYQLSQDNAAERNRIYLQDLQDPTMGEAHFLCPADLSHAPFQVFDADAEPIVYKHDGIIAFKTRNIVGPPLVEDLGTYERIADQVEDDVIQEQ